MIDRHRFFKSKSVCHNSHLTVFEKAEFHIMKNTSNHDLRINHTT